MPGCAACGYSLRGQPHDGACPECGAAVADALRPERLALVDAAWLRSVRGGLTCIILALGAHIATWPIILGLAIIATIPIQIGATARAALLLCIIALLGLGVVQLTKPISSPLRLDPTWRRLGTRWLLLIGIVLTVRTFAFGYAISTLITPEEFASWWSYYLAAVLTGEITLAAGAFLLLRRVAMMADRSERPLLARQLRILSWFFALGWSYELASWWLVVQFISRLKLLAVQSWAVGVPQSAVLLWLCIVLWRLRQRISGFVRDQAAEVPLRPTTSRGVE